VKKRREFSEAIRKVDPAKLVFLDEMGAHLSMTPTHARAPVGQRAICFAPGQRGSNISIVAAMRVDRVLSWYAHDGAVDNQRFCAFIERATPDISAGDVVVMDNVRFHHSANVRAAIEAIGATIMYIPPYHPEFNAIEELFSVVKRDLRRSAARTIADLVDALLQAFGRISGKSLGGFVKHALKSALQSS